MLWFEIHFDNKYTLATQYVRQRIWFMKLKKKKERKKTLKLLYGGMITCLREKLGSLNQNSSTKIVLKISLHKKFVNNIYLIYEYQHQSI